MAGSAHAYVRGSTAKFYEWLKEQKRGTFPEGPAVLGLHSRSVQSLGAVSFLYAIESDRYQALEPELASFAEQVRPDLVPLSAAIQSW